MSIRFHCANCHQRLSVPATQRGQQVKCPRCRRIVQVPREEQPEIDEASAVDSFPEVTLGGAAHGERASTISADPTPAPAANRVTLPRYVLYVQGFLLGAVALVFFVFGLIVGSRSAGHLAESTSAPVVVSGTVRLDTPAKSNVPDVDSVVLLLPAAKRPDARVAADGLGPESSPPSDDHPALRMLRSLGGDYARADPQGRYQVRAASAGRYYLVIISRGAKREEGEHPRATELAQLGRYFRPPTELLGQHHYRWEEILLREDTQWNVEF